MTDLPKGWARTTLGEIAYWGSGGTPARGDDSFYGGVIPWIVIGDLTDGPVTDTAESITEEGLKASSAKIIQPDAVLVAMYGASIGRLGLPTREMASNQAIAFAVPRVEVLDRKFLFWFLAAVKPELIGAGKGGAQPNISQTILKEWQIDLPPLAEQRRIVEILECHISQLKAAVQALTQSADRLRKLGDRVLTQLVNSVPHDRVPVARLLRAKPANGRSVPTAATGFPVLRLTSLRTGEIDLRERKIGDWTAEDARKYLVQQGDILLSRGNGSLHLVGRAGIVTAIPDPVAYPDTMIRLSPDTNEVLPEYLVTLWNASDARSQIEAAARTTAGIYKINQPIVGGIEIPIPDIATQGKIVEVVADFNQSFIRLAREILSAQRRAEVLRRSLLHAAFNGALVAQDPSDEPADVALARLRAAPKPVRKRAAKSSAAAATRR
ncbi:restriction endonuclease subunit S [Mycobacterium frederiksbergense]|uniref:restriction endonuclease subunit S n=1 Tax=Mycolicibacterium frederiksbergense TaxID=117567 RepID=UPI0021F2BE2D|nr:restriction endonuclease subunit S [Mycolicibacterium frederiksbergense]MCV7044174.1 restriction endonuclease subunit S [Mycolicibacterium frederiksbergense]